MEVGAIKMPAISAMNDINRTYQRSVAELLWLDDTVDALGGDASRREKAAELPPKTQENAHG